MLQRAVAGSHASQSQLGYQADEASGRAAQLEEDLRMALASLEDHQRRLAESRRELRDARSAERSNEASARGAQAELVAHPRGPPAARVGGQLGRRHRWRRS